jgi:hypothetical protein
MQFVYAPLGTDDVVYKAQGVLGLARGGVGEINYVNMLKQ